MKDNVNKNATVKTAKQKESASNITLISLFAGAGGMDIGFEKAGFKTIWANEYDKTIAPSYQNYFPESKFDGRSILDIPDEDIPLGATGVIGGPPCQSWSEAGAKRGLDDLRGQLFHEYIRVIRHVQPKFCVAENVHGIIHSRNIESFMNIIDMFKKEDYEVSWKLLKASDYGVAQDRERVFIIGYHKSLNKKFEFPKPLGTKITLKQVIGDLANLKVGTTREVKNHELIDSGYSPIFMSRNRVRGWDEQSFTILATDRHIPFHPQAPKMIKVDGQELRKFAPGHENKYRRLTVRECARIQTFPDDYEFIYTNIRNGYKMIGNAVPVNLAYWVAKSIRKDLGVSMATQTNNGRAFEWAVGLVLKLQTNMSIEENTYSEINEKAFYEIADRDKSDFLNAATIAIEHIMLKEKVFFESGNNGLISFNSDTAGKQGDVRDVLITINGKTFGISCKNNHKALKHPRLSRTANFIKEWSIDDFGCSDEYWLIVTTIFDELAKIKNDSNGTALWRDVINKPSRFYWPILDAWSNEISRVCAISEIKEMELCKTIISFIVGRFDFYKIIREGKKRVIVQGFNLNNTLSIKRTKHPTCINKNGGQYSKTIVFNRGYSINFRIHNAESKVTPSLKFDITAIGLPANEIYQQTFDL